MTPERLSNIKAMTRKEHPIEWHEEDWIATSVIRELLAEIDRLNGKPRWCPVCMERYGPLHLAEQENR